MRKLIIRKVNFYGDELEAVKNEKTGKIYTGVSYICKGIGLNKHEKDRQVMNVQNDVVLSNGCLKFEAGVFDQNNSTIALDINFLPLWLAKITITPAMQREQPQITDKLIKYQLKAKDVLAAAFVKPRDGNMKIISLLHAEIGELIDETNNHGERIENLENNMTIDYGQQLTLQEIVRKVALETMGGKESPAYKNKSLSSKVFSQVWKDYKEYFQINSYKNTPKLQYQKAKDYLQSWKAQGKILREIEEVNRQTDFNGEAVL